MTVEIEHHDGNDSELPTTEEIIDQLQNDEQCPVNDASRFSEVEGDIEIKHRACDGHVILRYRLWMGWDMDGDFGSGDGYEIHEDEIQEMTKFNLA